MEVAEAESRTDSSIKVVDFLLNASHSPIVAKVEDLVAVNEQVQLKALTEFYDKYVFSFIFLSTFDKHISDSLPCVWTFGPRILEFIG